MKSTFGRVRLRVSLLAAVGMGWTLSGCVSPSSRFDAFATGMGFKSEIVAGEGFQHAVYELVRSRGKRLHVYLDGDGTPWLQGVVPASDPTADDYLVLRLMAQDLNASVYLGRPCYHGLADAPSCGDYYYTHGRYSAEVVDSMASVLRRIVTRREVSELVFIGHSGGGVLAMLLAARLPETVGVVTVGANLDVDGWAAYHGYDPLQGSLNPATLAPLPPSIAEFHLAGGRDRVVPPALIQPVAQRSPSAVFRVVPDFDHACCWQGMWPDVLRELDSLLASRPAG